MRPVLSPEFIEPGGSLMHRLLIAVLSLTLFALPATAQQTEEQIMERQEGAAAPETAAPDRSATGGAQTLEDILRRQRGEPVDESFRSGNTGDPDGGAPIAAPLGTLGGASDPDLWRALR